MVVVIVTIVVNKQLRVVWEQDLFHQGTYFNTIGTSLQAQVHLNQNQVNVAPTYDAYTYGISPSTDGPLPPTPLQNMGEYSQLQPALPVPLHQQNHPPLYRERVLTIRAVVAKDGGEGGMTMKMTTKRRDGGGSGERCGVRIQTVPVCLVWTSGLTAASSYHSPT
ncbi:hypothetical protein EDD16DRAFT_1516510 [Pisolithus croceorrhizus]|nr:hypothetical protein EDD16DRAFT_1516510 [Pisolithus croceorrhizus]